MATSLQPCSSSQSARANTSLAVAPNIRNDLSTLPSIRTRAQATVSLRASRPRVSSSGSAVPPCGTQAHGTQECVRSHRHARSRAGPRTAHHDLLFQEVTEFSIDVPNRAELSERTNVSGKFQDSVGRPMLHGGDPMDPTPDDDPARVAFVLPPIEGCTRRGHQKHRAFARSARECVTSAVVIFRFNANFPARHPHATTRSTGTQKMFLDQPEQRT